ILAGGRLPDPCRMQRLVFNCHDGQEMNLTLKQLAVFDAIARLGSVSAAANELALTQSAASMALKQLEQSLEAELFLRVRKRLVLSQLGKALQPMARSVLLGAEEIATTVNAHAPAEQLRIGASPTVGDYLLPDL